MENGSNVGNKIMIADDEKLIRTGMAHLLLSQFTQLQVIEAADGISAFKLIQEQPDLQFALVDIRMPGMNGLELCEKIQAAGRELKIVIISGYSDFEYARSALRLGVTDYLLKPINPTEVLHIVREYAAESQLQAIENPGEPVDSPRKIVEKLKSWVHDHLQNDVTLIEVAELLHYSPNYLSVLFKKETGKGFQEYMTECRMQRAALLLQDPSLRIYEISFRVGYTNAKAFSIAFRNSFGLTPTEFRERN